MRPTVQPIEGTYANAPGTLLREHVTLRPNGAPSGEHLLPTPCDLGAGDQIVYLLITRRSLPPIGTFILPADYGRMESPSLTTRRALRQAHLYGYLVERDNHLFCPGGGNPVCQLKAAREMVRSGWLIVYGNKLEISPEGRLALELPALASDTRHKGRREPQMPL